MTISKEVKKVEYNMIDVTIESLADDLMEVRLTDEGNLRLYVNSIDAIGFIKGICDIKPQVVGGIPDYCKDDDDMLDLIQDNIGEVYEYLSSINLRY